MATKNFNLAKLARNINIEDDGSIAFTSEVSTGGETIGSLTASMDSDQTSTITLSKASTPVPIVQAYKEIPQTGISSKGQWNVNANATNYDFFDEKPISYASTTLTPSATGDGTFTSNSSIIGPTEISNLTYDNKSINITSLNHTGSGSYSDLRGLHIKPDGTKLFSLSNAGIVSEHVLSTAYDISTTTYNNIDTSVLTAQSSQVFDRDLFLSPDGTKLFVLEATTKEIARYDLSTAWDLSTLNTTKHSYYSETANFNSPYSFTFVPDGTGLIIFYNSVNSIIKYDLSTAWDLSTASRANFTIAPNSSSSNAYVGSTADIDLHSLEFADNGNVLIGSDYAQQKIYQWDLTSQYSITSSTSLAYDTQFGITLLAGNNVSYGPGPLQILNGKSYIVDGGTKSIIYQYTSSALSAFNAADVGKKVVGNSGSAIITATSGTYTSVTPFADTSAISSWQLFGAQGKSDGSGIVFTQAGTPGGIPTTFSSLSGPHTVSGQSEHGFHWSKDGTYYYIINQSNATIYRYICTTPWDATTNSAAQTLNAGGSGSKYGITVSEDGKHIYHGTYDEQIVHIPLSTAHDLTTAGSHTTYTVTGSYSGGSNPSINPSNANPWDMWVNSDGTKIWSLINGVGTRDTVIQFSMSTAYDISTASYENHFTMSPDGNDRVKLTNDGSRLYVTDDNTMRYWNLSPAYTLPANGTSPTNITLPAGGGTGKFFNEYYFHTASAQVNRYTLDTNIENSSTTPAYSQYFPALTNSSNGQINSSTWLDINSMTADETKNGGDVFYAVSTDNRTSWGVAKASDGVRKIARNNSGTWQYNNNAGVSTVINYDLSNSATLNKTLSYNSQDASGTAMAFNNDGTKLYYTGEQNNIIHEYALSTAYDISTSSYNSVTFNPSILTPLDIKWKPDGTKLYILDYDSSVRGTIYTFNVSTAWDITTASSASETFRGNAQDNTLVKFAFKTDGTRLYKLGRQGNKIYAYDLSTAWDVSSASYASEELPMANVVTNSTVGTSMNGLAFNSSGTKVFVAVYHSSNTSNNRIYEIDLSTAWDIGIDNNDNGNYAGVYLNTDRVINVLFNGDGSQVYAMNNTTDTILSYSSGSSSIIYTTSETWVNGTNNNEHATLQEALGAQAFNRMNKAQLDAVADAYHFSQDSADTLDLMIAPYAASGVSPISDGVTINYDAASKYRQAVPETDYRVDFSGTSTVEFTSNISANFKVKVV